MRWKITKDEKIKTTNDMEVEIKINGITRGYHGDYDTLHNNDWNEIVREMLDVQLSEERSYAKD